MSDGRESDNICIIGEIHRDVYGPNDSTEVEISHATDTYLPLAVRSATDGNDENDHWDMVQIA